MIFKKKKVFFLSILFPYIRLKCVNVCDENELIYTKKRQEKGNRGSNDQPDQNTKTFGSPVT